MTKLSKIDKVNPREIWKRESDFTKWLAKEENISRLSEKLQIKFEKAKVESAAGRYSVDIAADIAKDGGKVIIENQLEATDHKHLGQVITYASALDAKFVLWVVENFTDEHRQAIDWLNRNISEGINFFLIQVEVYKIDKSRPAPKFNVICEPEDWGKIAQNLSSDNKVSDTKLRQQEYWAQLIRAANQSEKSVKFSAKAPLRSWYSLRLGTSRANVALIINTQKKQFECEFYIGDDKKLFDDLYAQKDKIESDLALEGDLKWMRLDLRIASRILLTRDGDLSDKKSWNELNEWCIETSAKFADVFGDYL